MFCLFKISIILWLLENQSRSILSKKNHFSTHLFYLKIPKRQPIDPNKLVYSIKNPKIGFSKKT